MGLELNKGRIDRPRILYFCCLFLLVFIAVTALSVISTFLKNVYHYHNASKYFLRIFFRLLVLAINAVPVVATLLMKKWGVWMLTFFELISFCLWIPHQNIHYKIYNICFHFLMFSFIIYLITSCYKKMT